MNRGVHIGAEAWLAHVRHGIVNTMAIALLLSLGAREAQASTGSVCLSHLLLPTTIPDAQPAASSAVKIDDRPLQTLSDHSASLVTDLALDKKHRVRIFAGDKPIESFWFRFSQFRSRRLCLIRDNLYGTWRLFEAEHGGTNCRCPD